MFGVSSLNSEGRIISTAREKAETLNNQFCSVFTKEDLFSMPSLKSSNIPNMPDIQITNGVEKTVKEVAS